MARLFLFLLLTYLYMCSLFCGVMLLAGPAVRFIGLLLIINFVIAIFMGHIGNSFSQYYPAAQLIAADFFFLFNGAGPVSVDALREKDHGSNPSKA